MTANFPRLQMRTLICALLIAPLIVGPSLSWSADSSADLDLPRLQSQLIKVKRDASSQKQRVEEDEKLIRELQHRLDMLDSRNQKLNQTADQLQASDRALKDSMSRQEDVLQRQIASSVSPSQFDTWISRYLGQHQFTLNGAFGGDFIYNRQTSQNTFSVLFEPLILYRLNNWLLFEAEIEAGLPQGSSAEFGLPVANAQIFLNDYMEILAGVFDQPFGDFYEDQSAIWVNRMVTAPLPFGAEALVPPSDIGIQLRGSAQWGVLGQDADYTIWAANGPSYDTTLTTPVVGETLESPTNIGTQSNGRAYGARFRIYPLPFDTNFGRLELGASTYDGKWLNGNWLYSWGVDFAYRRGNLQTRGEYLEAYRQMPSPSKPDNRQGWYVQAGYFLQGLPSLGLNDSIVDAIHRLEPLIRYSGVNQPAIVTNEIDTAPEVGFNGSPSIFSPHAREVALGLDYWIEPSIVWQTELDFELPRAGGTLTTVNGGSVTNIPAGATANDRSILTQLAIGF